MAARGHGSLVLVGSTAGIFGEAGHADYAAAKSAVVYGLMLSLKNEVVRVAPRARVNAVCPGWIKTPMDDVDQAKGTYSDGDITGRVPMGRFATAEDVARAIAFLADPVESGFVNGHTLVIDGGWTADGSWQSLRASHRRPESG